MKQFEEASGVTLDRWHGTNIGEAFGLVQRLGLHNTLELAKRMARDMKRHGDNLESLVQQAREEMGGKDAL